MENVKSTGSEAALKKTRAQVFLEEWKRRRKADEEAFLKEVHDPAHRRRMEKIAGKIVSNGEANSIS